MTERYIRNDRVEWHPPLLISALTKNPWGSVKNVKQFYKKYETFADVLLLSFYLLKQTDSLLSGKPSPGRSDVLREFDKISAINTDR